MQMDRDGANDVPMGTYATLGHVALHYQEPQDGPLAARLLKAIGFTLREEIALPDGSAFYHFLVDGRARNMGDGILYLSPLRRAHRWLYDSIREALHVGTEKEHPAVAKVRGSEAVDPEAGFHVGFLMPSLEVIEQAMARVQGDPALAGRVQIIANRAPRGDPTIDARLDASPLFGSTERQIFGRNGVQVFIRTDLLCSGPLGEDLVLEFDYVFPGFAENMLTRTKM